MVNTSGKQAPIGNGQTLNADAAVYWHALVAAVFALTGTRVIPTEGTRTYSRQADLYRGWVNRLPGYNPAWSPDSPFAYHLSGRAVDVGSQVGYVGTPVSKAFYSIARDYGFDASIDNEPWHFEWRNEWVSKAIRDRINAHEIKIEIGHGNMFVVNCIENNGTVWAKGDKYLISGPTINGIARVSTKTCDLAKLKPSPIKNGDMLGLLNQFRISVKDIQKI